MTKVTWYGHAAFKLEGPELSVIIDPYKYPDAGGYEPIDDSADAVVISHVNDRYHSHTGQIKGAFELLKAHEFPPEGVTFRGVRFSSLPVYETPEKLPGDEVTIVRFELGGLSIVFLGDLGHSLTEDERERLGRPDILLAPTGGKPTIALEDLVELIGQLQPRWVVPMHFKTDKINLNILPNEAFLDLARGRWEIRRFHASSAEFTSKGSSDETVVVVLDHLR
jgi:L-ascorbate metabolism protein UlaG (beta-lactamase superfamily)